MGWHAFGLQPFSPHPIHAADGGHGGARGGGGGGLGGRVGGGGGRVQKAESVRLNLARGGNNLFLVAPAEPLHAGREYEFEFRHSGKVIHEAGDHVYYVSSRGNWYPANGHNFASYDLTFRFPRELDLVSVGDTVEDRVEGDLRVVRRRTSAPVRIAGFNLGD